MKSLILLLILCSSTIQAQTFDIEHMSKGEILLKTRSQEEDVPTMMKIVLDYLNRHSWTVTLFDTVAHSIKATYHYVGPFTSQNFSVGFLFQPVEHTVPTKSIMYCNELSFEYFEEHDLFRGNTLQESNPPPGSSELANHIYQVMFDAILHHR